MRRGILSVKPFSDNVTLKPLPRDVRYLCTCKMFLNPVDFDEALFFESCLEQGPRRTRAESTEAIHVLWCVPNVGPDLIADFECGRIPAATLAWPAVTARWRMTPMRSACRMIDTHVESKSGFCWPLGLRSPGLVDESRFLEIVASVKGRLDRRAAAARKLASAPIVAAARELGLNPRPSGTSGIAWRATCPGTSHFLMIGADTNTFGCGWCKRRGGVAEIRAFVLTRPATIS